MKTRLNFVSNSSSSSFIIGFKRKPKSAEEVHNLLYGKIPRDIKVFDHTMSTTDISDRVFEDIKNQSPLKVRQFKDIINSGWFEGCPAFSYDHNSELHQLERRFYKDYPGQTPYYGSYNNKNAEKLANKIRKLNDEEMLERETIRNKAVKEYLNLVRPKFKNMKCFHVSYSDNSGESLLEHGDIFYNIPHIQISHH